MDPIEPIGPRRRRSAAIEAILRGERPSLHERHEHEEHDARRRKPPARRQPQPRPGRADDDGDEPHVDVLA